MLVHASNRVRQENSHAHPLSLSLYACIHKPRNRNIHIHMSENITHKKYTSTMHKSTYLHIYISTYVYIYIYIHTYTHVHTYVYTNTYIHVHIHIQTHTCTLYILTDLACLPACLLACAQGFWRVGHTPSPPAPQRYANVRVRMGLCFGGSRTVLLLGEKRSPEKKS